MASIPRSPAMIRAAYFLAKFSDVGPRGALPPSELNASSWEEAYRRLFPRLGDGRSFETFRNSIDQDRQHYIKCLAGRKVDTQDRQAILGDCMRLDQAGLWAVVRQDIEPLVGATLPQAMPTDRAISPGPAGPRFAFPEEVPTATTFVEGAVRQVTVNAYERDPDARRRCIEHHGTTCCLCNFNFAARYGPIAEGYIHVHHLRPLSEVKAAHAVDPIADLRPVCPNCHAVLHLRAPAYSIEEVRAFLR